MSISTSYFPRRLPTAELRLTPISHLEIIGNKSMAKTYKIHPSIGIARVGNSLTQFFIGPEIPGVPPMEILTLSAL